MDQNRPMTESTGSAAADTAVLYMTHFWSEAQLRKFLRLHRAARRRFDVYLLLDRADVRAEAAWRRDLSAAGIESCIATFDKTATLQRLGHQAFRKDMTQGSMHFPVIEFAQDRPGYRHYWLIESDVHIASWGRFLRSFRRSEADLLLAHLGGYADVPRWPHWQSLKAPEDMGIGWNGGEGATPLRGFLPVYRISRHALDCLDAAHAEGWRGHMEAVIPTVLHAHGLRVEDFNDHGRFYTPGPTGPRDGKTPYSSHRWSPPIDPASIRARHRRRIYHPLKE
jgi:hypothetical protein